MIEYIRKKKIIYFALTFTLIFTCARLGVVRSAYAETPLTIIADGRKYCFYYPELYICDGEYRLRSADEIAERISLDLTVKPTDAAISFSPTAGASPESFFKISREKSGRYIDAEKVKAQIDYALSSGKREIVVRSKPTLPEITRDYLKEETRLRATFSTVYAASSQERKHNIELAVKSLNGAIIDLYEDFSFNEQVGARTPERGYQSAKIISDGKFTDGIGGGVCQVSTTLYNAAIRAGLTITEYHRHTLAVSYVPPSFDAMVSGSVCDLKIGNKTGRRCYVAAFADGNRITISIYGAENELEYRYQSSVDEIIQASVKKVPYDSDLKPVAPKNGIKSSAYVTICKNGRIIASYKFRSDTYLPLNGIEIEKSD